MTNEESVCKEVIKMLSKEFDSSKFGIEQRSSEYLSLIFCDNDFFRCKYTDKTRWISIRLAKGDRNVDDPRFDAQKKKGQLHWKANINSIDDLKYFEDVLLNACISFMGDEYVPRKNNKSTITLGFDFLKNKIIK